jgi:hemoglobin
MTEPGPPTETKNGFHPVDPFIVTPSVVRKASTQWIPSQESQETTRSRIRWWQRRHKPKGSGDAWSRSFPTVHEALRWVSRQQTPDRFEVVVRPQSLMSWAQDVETAWERLRTDGTLRSGVDLFYDRVTRHPRLARYFKGVDVVRLRRHMFGMLVKVTGGPDSAYTGGDLRTVHRNLGITHADYDLTIAILVEALRDVHVPEAAITDLGERIVGVRDEVVSLPR